MRIFKNAWFERFARKERIADLSLCEAIHRAERGLIDADLGGGVIKQRIAREKQGKSGGYRTIVLFRTGDKAFFVYGFAKNCRENLDNHEITTFKQLAKEMLKISEDQLEELIHNRALTEVNCND